MSTKIKFTVLILLGVLFSSHSSFGRAKIPVGEIEVLKKVHDFPNTEEFELSPGRYIDLATKHTEFNIAYILPLWITKDSELVGYDEVDDTYYEIPEAELNALLAEQKLDKEKLNQVPFYNKYGGKAIVLVIIAIIIYGMLPSKKRPVQAKEM